MDNAYVAMIDAGFFAEDSLPSPLAGGQSWTELAFAAIRGDLAEVEFDPPRSPVWRGSVED